MIISRRSIQSFLNRKLDSYVWMKRLKEQALLEELSKFRVKPKFKTTPWLHQLVCFYLGMCNPEFLFLLDMGCIEDA